jgi:hypothetical protein
MVQQGLRAMLPISEEATQTPMQTYEHARSLFQYRGIT